MKPTQKHNLKPIIFSIIFFISLWVLPMPKIDKFPVFNDMMEIQNASADEELGILGQPAPEIKPDTWVDENGKEAEPIHLKDYRGKIVYLYFFQDG
ncbi:MAG: hypothetical protein HKO68_06625 [Desulfobacterales bacterium]|nr:hypothetical protein [Desulfobacterales bacterium]